MLFRGIHSNSKLFYKYYKSRCIKKELNIEANAAIMRCCKGNNHYFNYLHYDHHCHCPSVAANTELVQ